MDTGLTLAQFRTGLIFYFIFIASLCIREWARAWTIDKLGDPNPAAQGRLTLNPIAHMDLFGSVIFPLVCIFFPASGIVFGWGKPVIPNPSYFSNPKRGEVIAALSGPVANFLVALGASVFFGFAHRISPATEQLYANVLLVNIMLAVFNLVPLPPLDGGVLLKHLVGMSEITFYRISQWSLLVWLAVIWLNPVQVAFITAMNLCSMPFELIYRLIA